MQKTQRRNLILYTIILVCAMLILVTSTFAWFASSYENSGSVMIYTGDMDLNMTIKQGIDSSRDGNLDIYYNGNLTVDTNSSRGDINKYLFTSLKKEGITKQQQLSAGSYLTYKIIIENANKTNALISVNFSNLAEYFMGLMSEDEADWLEILVDNTGRIMYSLTNIVVRNYEQEGSEESSLENGYSKLVASSLQSEATVEPVVKHITNVNTTEKDESVERITNVNTTGKDEFYMWEISHQEEFVNNILVKSNEVVEIMFQLKCNDLTEIVEEYMKYQAQLITSAGDDVKKIAHIEKVIKKELELIVEINTQNAAIDLSFTIDEIYIHATQTSKEEYNEIQKR